MMTDIVANQNDFTAMKGHVMNENRVLMNDGTICTLAQNSYGWVLKFSDGEVIQLGFSAFQVECKIVNSTRGESDD